MLDGIYTAIGCTDDFIEDGEGCLEGCKFNESLDSLSIDLF